jgi:hypothetical protein
LSWRTPHGWAPNDFCFNKLIRDGFDERKLLVLQDRAKTSAARKRNGDELPDLSKEELRQLTLYHLRRVIFDEHGLVRLPLRHSIQHFWKHTGLSLALDRIDIHDYGTKLQDGSIFEPPLPDLSTYILGAESVPLQAAERPEQGLLRMQAKRACRTSVVSGDVDMKEALAQSAKKARRNAPAYDVGVVSAVLQHTSLPLPSTPLPPQRNVLSLPPA